MDRGELEALDRESLVARAEAAGIRRARILTRPELVDELLRLDPRADEAQLRRARGFFGRARDLLARVVERGLHLPDAADRIRTTNIGTLPPSVPRPEPQALPTVTLAEIYAAQGHKERAIDTLRRVLEREPEHDAARALLARLEDAAYIPPPPPLPPEPEVEPLAADAPDEDEEEDEAIEAERAEAAEPGPHPAEDDEEREVECVAVPLGEGAVFVSFRVDEASIVDARGSASAARFVVRAVVVEPTWDGPRSHVRDVEVDPASGELVLQGLPERAVVRVAVGVASGDGFAPIAHSPALEARRGALARWTLRGTEPVSLDHPRAAAVARAVEAARRAVPSARVPG